MNDNDTNSELQTLITPILQEIDGDLNVHNMHKLNSDQITLFAYYVLRQQLLEGGFVQLIQNGYGPFIFLNPFAKAMRLWGLKEFSKWLYDARELYEKSKAKLECPTNSEEDFMALYEQYPEWDEFDDYFIEEEPSITLSVCKAYKNNTVQ